MNAKKTVSMCFSAETTDRSLGTGDRCTAKHMCYEVNKQHSWTH